MARISCLPRLKSLPSIIASSSHGFPPYGYHDTLAKSPWSRSISSTSSSQAGTRTDWVRSKLWKGEAPGAKDPYAPRDADLAETSNLPDEAITASPGGERTLPYPLRVSSLQLPPQRSEAATQEEVQARDAMYTPAESIEELESVPSLNKWWEQPGNWGGESVFRGFGLDASKKVTDRDVMEVYLRRATVEALALSAQGEAIFGEWSARRWNEGGREELDKTLALGVDAQGHVQGDVKSLLHRLMGEEAGETEQIDRISAQEAGEMIKGWDQTWKDVAVDEKLKFAIRKRLYQLTGSLLPDSKLAAASTVRHMLTLATKPPKATTLHEILEKNEEIAAAPNMSISRRRITPIDKEVKLGRWKVIKEELRKRNLPVTGFGGHDGQKEKDWIMPKRKMVRGMGSSKMTWE